MGPTRNISTPIAGYSGFIPNFKDTEPSLQYRSGLETARKMQPDEETLNVGMTPSMREAVLGENANTEGTGSLTARPPTTARSLTTLSGRPKRAAVVLTRQQKVCCTFWSFFLNALFQHATQPDRKSGYTGFKPQPPLSPEAYKGCKGATTMGLYFGDLTQYWNDEPYLSTYREATRNVPQVPSKVTPRRW